MTSAEQRQVQLDGYVAAAAKGVNPDGLTEADQRRLQYEACVGGWPIDDCNEIVQGYWSKRMRFLQLSSKKGHDSEAQELNHAKTLESLDHIMREMKVYCDGQAFKAPLCGMHALSTDDNINDNVPLSHLPTPSHPSSGRHDEL